MGEDGAGLARVAAAKGSGMAGLWLILPALLAIVAPVIGFAAVVGDPAGFHRMGASTAVPIAGACFAIAAVVQVVAAIWWLRSGRAREYMLFILAFGTAVLGAATSWVMGSASSFDGFAGAAAWRVPVLLAAALGAAHGVLMLALGRPAALDAETPAPAAGDGLQAALDAIPDDELQTIRADRDAALARLVERGRLTQPWPIAPRAPSWARCTGSEPGRSGAAHGHLSPSRSRAGPLTLVPRWSGRAAQLDSMRRRQWPISAHHMRRWSPWRASSTRARRTSRVS